MFCVTIDLRKDDYVLKKAFLTISILIILVFSAFSVYALENTMTNTNVISNTNGYTFECVITPTITASCKPVIAMFDVNGALCGLMYGDNIALTSGQRTVKTFTASASSTPTEIKVMLWKTDESYAPLSRFEQVSTTLCTEKFGMITELNSSNGVQIFATDGSYNTYTLADDVILSHSKGIEAGKTAATNHIEALKLSYYTRNKVPTTLWKIFADERTCFKDTSGSTASAYKYPDFLNNYTKRMVRFLATSDNLIVSMAFEDDKLFKILSSVKTLNEAFYTSSTRSFNDSLQITSNARILYIPAKVGSTESEYAVKAPTQIKEGNYYHAKVYTANGNNIVLMTYMFTDAEIQLFNKKPLDNITIALNGDGKTINGIQNYVFNIALSGQTDLDNDTACDAADLAMEYVANGLSGALEAANNGYVITPEFVKIKFKDDIQKAKAQINIIKQLDSKLGLSPGYYSEFENVVPKAIGNSAMTFLKDYFLGG